MSVPCELLGIGFYKGVNVRLGLEEGYIYITAIVSLGHRLIKSFLEKIYQNRKNGQNSFNSQ